MIFLAYMFGSLVEDQSSIFGRKYSYLFGEVVQEKRQHTVYI